MKKLLLTAAIALFATTANTASAGEKQYGNWTYHEEVDPVANQVKAWISTHATQGTDRWGNVPYMGLDCDKMYFGDVGVLDDPVVLWRFDHQAKAASKYGAMWQGYTGVSLRWAGGTRIWSNGKYKRHFENSIREGTLFVQFNPYASSNETFTFSMKGFTNAINHLAATCSK